MTGKQKEKETIKEQVANKQTNKHPKNLMSKSFQNPKLVAFPNLAGWPRSDPRRTNRLWLANHWLR